MSNTPIILKNGFRKILDSFGRSRFGMESPKVLGKIVTPLLGMGIGAWLIQHHSHSQIGCEASQIVYKKIADAHVLQYPANNPIEDRYVYAPLKAIPAKLAVILDRHGGFAICDLTSRPRL